MVVVDVADAGADNIPAEEWILVQYSALNGSDMARNLLVLLVVAFDPLVDTTMTQNQMMGLHTEQWVGRIHVTRSVTPVQNKVG